MHDPTTNSKIKFANVVLYCGFRMNNFAYWQSVQSTTKVHVVNVLVSEVTIR